MQTLLSTLGKTSLDVFCVALGDKQFHMHPWSHTVLQGL